VLRAAAVVLLIAALAWVVQGANRPEDPSLGPPTTAPRQASDPGATD
jgi:hypothetical protein